MANAEEKKLKKVVRTTVSLPVQDYQELERIAEQKKVSVAWVVRAAVEDYLAAQSPVVHRSR
jgi:metal-responsive CopG/Arc/MetJ family transcriptional regulator